MDSVGLMKEIESEELEIKELECRIRALKVSIAYNEKQLRRAGKEKRYLAEKDFIRKTFKLEETDSNIYVVFDKYGNLKRDIRLILILTSLFY